MSIKLSTQNLPKIAKNAAIPQYNRGDLHAGIVHFGIGNFHRAHQAIYLDSLFNQNLDHDWAIVGAGVLPGDKMMRERLCKQDYLTTVVEQDAKHSSARVTASMTDFLEIGNGEQIIARLIDPAIRIVSLTITEGGYYIDPASGAFNPAHPDIVAEARRRDSPETVFGLMLAALEQRRKNNTIAFTIMSCDNIPGNGDVTRDTVAGLAELRDPHLAQWVRDEVAFPNSMVDRITPATSERERTLLVDDFGIDDAWPVYCEDFKQWVLEDHFPAGRPALERAGVQFVADVSRHEHMKIRILNGGHAAIAYPAALMGIHFVHGAMGEPLIRDFLSKLETEEIIPVIPPVPDTDLGDYLQLIVRRFANPKIADTIPRLCQDGSNRQPKFILRSTADRLARGDSITGLSLVSALWCRYCAGTNDSGDVIADNDISAERLKAAAIAAKNNPAAFLALKDIFGAVTDAPAFQKKFANALESLWAVGTQETLRRYLSDAL